MQLGLSFFISEDSSYTTRFMNATQKRHHRFWRHRLAVFWSYNDFAFVLGAAKEEAKCAFELFLGCEFFYDFVKYFVMVESEYEDSCKFGFSVIQGFSLFYVKTESLKYKRIKLGQNCSVKEESFLAYILFM